MRTLLTVAFSVAVYFIQDLNAQHLFPEKFAGCVTEQFALERGTTEAKVDNSVFIETITSTLDDKTRDKISGTLTFQIIVDTDGKSCLLSLKNDTNIKTKKLDFKEAIDQSLVWDESPRRVAAIVLLVFRNGEIALKRLGVDAGRGVHLLED